MFGKLHGEPQNSSLTSADNPSAAAHFVHCPSLVHWLPNSAPYTGISERWPCTHDNLGCCRHSDPRKTGKYTEIITRIQLQGAQQRPAQLHFFRNPQKDRLKYFSTISVGFTFLYFSGGSLIQWFWGIMSLRPGRANHRTPLPPTNSAADTAREHQIRMMIIHYKHWILHISSHIIYTYSTYLLYIRVKHC